MSGLSKMIADFFVRENVIEHEEYEIYKYGYNPSSNGGITVSVGGTWEP